MTRDEHAAESKHRGTAMQVYAGHVHGLCCGSKAGNKLSTETARVQAVLMKLICSMGYGQIPKSASDPRRNRRWRP